MNNYAHIYDGPHERLEGRRYQTRAEFATSFIEASEAILGADANVPPFDEATSLVMSILTPEQLKVAEWQEWARQGGQVGTPIYDETQRFLDTGKLDDVSQTFGPLDPEDDTPEEPVEW